MKEACELKKGYYDCDWLCDLRELVDYAARSYGDKVGYRELDHSHRIVEYSFNELKSDVDALGTKFQDMGLQGKTFALIGESTYRYVASYMAVVNGGGVIVPLDRELNNEDLAKMVNRSDSEVVLFSQALRGDIEDILSLTPGIRMAIDIGPQVANPTYFSFDELVQSGRLLLESGRKEYLDAKIDPDRLCSILFTSGTTGANKGVMLSHRNLVTVVHSSFSIFRMPEVSFSVLPINHTYEFNVHVLCSLYGGITLCFNDTLKRLRENLALYRPEMSLMVPMIVEAMYRNIWKEAEKNRLAAHLRYGIWFSNLIRKIGIDKRELYFKPILDSFGGNLRIIVCGGAPLRPEIIKGFDDLGISVYNGYGITECAPLISSNSMLRNVPGSVGMIAPDCEVRIGDVQPDGTGEIQVRGKNVMLGYYKDEEATKKTFTEDGWFKTGDIGYLGKNDTVFITGREKNLIILANGKNVHPEELEEVLMFYIPYVKEVVVYAPENSAKNENIISADAYLDPDFINQVGMEKAKAIFDEDVKKVNRRLSSYKRIHQAHIRETEFEKTTTKKIKRFALAKGSTQSS